MYLVVTEYGDSLVKEDCDDELINEAECGIIDLFDARDSKNILRYGNDGWEAVDKA
jgi:hypothetical protein